jgi:CBS domain-containing protein
MTTVRRLLKAKGPKLWTISPQTTAYEGLKMMADHNLGALLVVEGGNLVGVFSERDYARKVILKGKSSKNTPIGELMVTSVIYVTLDNTIEDCMALITDKRTRHLPVLENDELIGIISIGDVVRQIISEQELTIRELEKYIKGSY